MVHLSKSFNNETSLLKDYVLTITVQFMVLASILWVYRLSAELLGTNGFSIYAMSRRTISFIHPVLLMGLGVGIPRYIAHGYGNLDKNNPDDYYISALLVIIPVVCTLCFFLNLFSGMFSYLFFGDSNFSHLILPITSMIIGGVLDSLCYSYLRGKLMMLRANLLQIITAGIIPPVAFLMFGNSLETVLLATGVSWIIIALIFIFFLPLDFRNCNPKMLIPCAKEIFSYSIMRVPGDFAFSSLLALPAIFTVHLSGIQEGGYMAFGIAVFNMCGSFFAPISTILLPKASHMIARENYNGLKFHLKKLLIFVVCLTIPGVIILEAFTSEIIGIYLKQDLGEAVSIIKVLAIGITPYVIYILLRSVIDAEYKKPINTINLVITLLFFLIEILYLLFFDIDYYYIYIAGIFTVSIYILGGLSLHETSKIF